MCRRLCSWPSNTSHKLVCVKGVVGSGGESGAGMSLVVPTTSVRVVSYGTARDDNATNEYTAIKKVLTSSENPDELKKAIERATKSGLFQRYLLRSAQERLVLLLNKKLESLNSSSLPKQQTNQSDEKDQIIEGLRQEIKRLQMSGSAEGGGQVNDESYETYKTARDEYLANLNKNVKDVENAEKLKELQFFLSQEQLNEEYILFSEIYIDKSSAENMRGAAEMATIHLGDLLGANGPAKRKEMYDKYIKQKTERKKQQGKMEKERIAAQQLRVERDKHREMNKEAYNEIHYMWKTIGSFIPTGDTDVAAINKLKNKRSTDQMWITIITAKHDNSTAMLIEVTVTPDGVDVDTVLKNMTTNFTTAASATSVLSTADTAAKANGILMTPAKMTERRAGVTTVECIVKLEGEYATLEPKKGAIVNVIANKLGVGNEDVEIQLDQRFVLPKHNEEQWRQMSIGKSTMQDHEVSQSRTPGCYADISPL
mgnify:FL=1